MNITVLIPTRGERAEGFKKAIASVDVKADIRVLKNTDGWLPNVNAALRDVDGYMLLAGDDMVYHPMAIDAAMNAMMFHFPDTDGVVGFNQVGLPGHCEAGFVLIGQKFIQRFEDKQVYCPDYKHYYADTEFLKYSKGEGKFYYCKEAKVDHYHWSLSGTKDSTTAAISGNLADDKAMHKIRADAGYLWGRDSERVKNG